MRGFIFRVVYHQTFTVCQYYKEKLDINTDKLNGGERIKQGFKLLHVSIPVDGFVND